MKNLVLLVSLIFFLSSCQTLEHQAEQCTIDLEAQKCFCRQYKFSKAYVGGVDASVEEKEFLYCNKLVGFTVNDYAGVATFWEKVRREINEKEKPE